MPPRDMGIKKSIEALGLGLGLAVALDCFVCASGFSLPPIPCLLGACLPDHPPAAAGPLLVVALATLGAVEPSLLSAVLVVGAIEEDLIVASTLVDGALTGESPVVGEGDAGADQSSSPGLSGSEEKPRRR